MDQDQNTGGYTPSSYNPEEETLGQDAAPIADHTSEPMSDPDELSESELNSLETEDEDFFFGDSFANDSEIDNSVEITRPLDADKKIESPLSGLQGTSEYVRKHLDAIGFDEERLETEIKNGNQDWVVAIIRGIESTMSESETMTSVADRPGSYWNANPTHEGMPITAAKTRVAFSKQNNSLVQGSDALRLYDSFTSSGRTFEIPLWHSGIWIYIKRPNLAASLTLDSKIATDKINLGRDTRGASFSNSDFFISKNVLDLVMDHMYDHTVKGADKDTVRSLIDVRDLPTIAWGLALTEYPSGFPYEQPCVSNPDKCNHVTQEVINLHRIHRVDDNAFTDKQREYMSRRNVKRTIAEIEEYRKSTYPKDATKTINKNIKLVLSCPTADENIASGYAWANEIRTATTKAFTMSISDEQRTQYEINHSLATRLRTYSHWVKAIVMTDADGENTNRVEDRDTIYQLLNTMSSERQQRNLISDAIKDFMVESLNVLIGTPNFQCPSCNSYMMDPKGPMRKIIPWDAMSVFFSLQQFKLQRNMSD